MATEWSLSESQDCDFQDKRLNQRYVEVLDAFASQPNASIPSALGGRTETTAAYRFLNNKKVTFEKVISPHISATLKRVCEQKVVICVQDTTEIDVTRPQQQVQDTGPLDGSTRHGGFLHALQAFTPDGTPLGTLAATVWTREAGVTTVAGKKRSERAKTPIEDKESFRWIQTALKVQEFAVSTPETLFVAVSDSESDIFEMMCIDLKETPNFHWIIRGCQNRALDAPGEDDETYIIEQIRKQPVLFIQEISVRGRTAKIPNETRPRVKSRDPRKATLEVRAGTVKLRAPYRVGTKLKPQKVNVVLVEEINPPKDATPVQWVLITSLPIKTVEEVRTVAHYYAIRWTIEVFFRTLKTGCRVEKRRFETWARMLPCLALYLIVAWRTLYVCYLGRSCPDVSCELIFEPSEWKSVSKFVTNEVPDKPPKLTVMVDMVARLGGYVNRNKGGEPGAQVIWQGLQRMHDLANCWDLFGPGAEAKKPKRKERSGNSKQRLDVIT